MSGGDNSLAENHVTSTQESNYPRRKKKVLPPCRICGEPASGLHYGVNTCEACKGFFRRSLGRGHLFQCAENGECHIAPGQRSTCAACRYAKCIQMGMSKEAIKIGRYTHEKRTQDICEVRHIQKPSLDTIPVTIKAEMFENECGEQIVTARTPETRKSSTSSQRSLESEPSPKLARRESADETTSLGFSSLEVDSIYRYMKGLSEALVSMKYFFTAAPPQFLHDLISKRLEDNNLELELCGGSIMPVEEYISIFKQTGLDLDQRRQLIKDWAESMEETFIVLVQAAKCIPGFKQLPFDDQIVLLKARRSQILYVASHHRFDVKNRCFIGRFNRVDSYEDMMKVYDSTEFVDNFLKTASLLQKIPLSDLEWMLVITLLITWPAGKGELTNVADITKQQLHEMHKSAYRAMQFYLSLNQPHLPKLVDKVLQGIQEVRTMQKAHDQLARNVRAIWREHYHFPPLLEEMLASDSDKLTLRMTPKHCDSPAPVATPSPLLHWKKSKIAQILESTSALKKDVTEAPVCDRHDSVSPELGVPSVISFDRSPVHDSSVADESGSGSVGPVESRGELLPVLPECYGMPLKDSGTSLGNGSKVNGLSRSSGPGKGKKIITGMDGSTIMINDDSTSSSASASRGNSGGAINGNFTAGYDSNPLPTVSPHSLSPLGIQQIYTERNMYHLFTNTSRYSNPEFQQLPRQPATDYAPGAYTTVNRDYPG